jgi:hypothetical protein
MNKSNDDATRQAAGLPFLVSEKKRDRMSIAFRAGAHMRARALLDRYESQFRSLKKITAWRLSTGRPGSGKNAHQPRLIVVGRTPAVR